MKTNIFLPTTNKGYVNYENKVQAITIKAIRAVATNEGYRLNIRGNVGGVRARKIETDGVTMPVYQTEADAISGKNTIAVKEFILTNALNLVGYPQNILYVFANGKVEARNINELDLAFVAENKEDENGQERTKWNASFCYYDKVFADKSICTKSYDVEVVEQDRTTHIHKSALSRITLTEEQRAKVNELMNTFKELNEMGVKMFTRTDYDDLAFINAQDVTMDWGYEDDNEYGDSYELIPQEQRYDLPVHILWSEDNIFIKA